MTRNEAGELRYVMQSKARFAPVFTLAFFLVLFGPKFGLVDTSLIGGLIGLMIVLVPGTVRIHRDALVLITWVSVILCYTLLVYMVAERADSYIVLRTLRAFFATIFISVTIYNVRLPQSVMISIIINILLMHALAVLVQIAVPMTKLYFATLYLFDKKLTVSMRAFGLTAGYDMAGYLCIAGMVLALLAALYGHKNPRNILRGIVFGTAAMFTSRVSMLVTVIVVLVFGVVFCIKGRRTLKLAGILSIVGSLMIAGTFVLPLVLNTLSFNDVSLNYSYEYTSSFAATDISSKVAQMWIFPADEVSMLFGRGVKPSSDIGYIRMIFMVGLTGLSMTLGMYSTVLLRAVRLLRSARRQFSNQISKQSAPQIVALVTLIITVGLQFALNGKNLYWFTRGVFELTIILFAIATANVDRSGSFKERA